jgi:hypothetical protein
MHGQQSRPEPDTRRGETAVVVGSDYIPRIQEVQASVYHVVRRLIGAVG